MPHGATMKVPLLPTKRAAIFLGLAAPAAVVIAATAPSAWVVAPAFAAAIIALVLADGVMAGRLLSWQLETPADVEIGQEAQAQLLLELGSTSAARSAKLALELDPRLNHQGRAEADLKRGPSVTRGKEAVRQWGARFALHPQRRGNATLSRLWLRWQGPLGLGARQAEIGLEGRSVRIWPDLSQVRGGALQYFMREADIGQIARRMRGEGTQFESLREYEPGMDRRWIEWKASARHTRLYARENETERNNQIVFGFDCGHTMCEPVAGLPRLDRAISAALSTAYIAVKGGDKVAIYGFAARPQIASPFVSGSHNFYRLQQAAASLEYSDEEPNFTYAIAALTARLKRRSLVVLFSDFTDPVSAEIMLESIGRLTRRHVVIFVTIEDSELSDLLNAAPETLSDLAGSVSAAGLTEQRKVVLERLRQMGVHIIEAPWEHIGNDLIDRYLRIKRVGAIG